MFSYTRRCLGSKPQPITSLLPNAFKRLLQRDVHARREKETACNVRTPWFLDWHSCAGASELTEAFEEGWQSIVEITQTCGRQDAVRAGTPARVCITSEEIEARRRALAGQLMQDQNIISLDEEDIKGLSTKECTEKAANCVEYYERTYRSIHIV